MSAPVSAIIYYINTSIFKTDIFDGYVQKDQYKIDILHYSIHIDLYPGENKIAGNVILTGVKNDKSLNQINLNFYDNLSIKSLKLNQRPAEYDRSERNLTIYLNEEAPDDTFQVQIMYEGTPRKTGMSSFSFDKFSGRSAVYTLNEPIYASTWLPCNDIPSDKALADIYITNDSSKVSVSNGLLAGISASANGRKTYHWKVIYPISTYLICLYSANYSVFSQPYISASGDTMDMDYYVFPEHLEMAKYDMSVHADIMNVFSKLFGEYPFIKEKYGVAEFLWQLGAMEHQTITGIGSNFINGKRFFNDFYIHELAHQWWGNAVGPATWKDVWLNEGFASYSEALYYESSGGTEALNASMQSMFQDDFPGTLYNPSGDIFNETVYDKGAWVLHMLRNELGDDIFFRVLREYYNTYKYRSASTEDFRNLCQKISGKDLNQFFQQWVYKGSGIAELQYKWTAVKNSGGYSVSISVEQVQDGYDTYIFPMEIQVVMPNSNENFSKIVYIDRRKKNIEFTTGKLPMEIILDPENKLLMKVRKS
ncbi:MAG: M1 family metallopeptidase [Bacteroidota bacterium]